MCSLYLQKFPLSVGTFMTVSGNNKSKNVLRMLDFPQVFLLPSDQSTTIAQDRTGGNKFSRKSELFCFGNLSIYKVNEII